MTQLGIVIDLKNKNLIFPTHTMKIKSFKAGSKNISFTNGLPRTQLEELLEKYEKLFDTESTLPYTGDITHSLELLNEKPIHKKQYRYPNAQIPEIKRQINELLANDIIQESKSPWNSPIIIVNKKDDESGKKKFRMVIDYRELNAKTIDDRFPVPNIEELLDQLNDCKYFSVIDLKSGFHQVKMNPVDIPKTAFSILGNHYEFKRMPFGLKNAPSTFLRLMNRTLNKYIGNICLCYMDDIIVYSKSRNEHIQHLDAIFKTLNKANMRIQLDKCKFMEKQIKFLGHIVNTEGIQPDPDKIDTITKVNIPKTPKQIKQFLGLIGYYRKFIKNFAEKTKPISKLLKKEAKINPKDGEYLKCFEECKALLTTKPILEYPDFNKTFRLTTDASDYAIGAILSHDDTDKPIAYASRTLNEAETRYDATNKELLAIIWATKHFRPYLYGTKFEIHTDHRPLEWLMSLKDPSSKLVRWRLKLSEFDFKINYKKGTRNSNADALSRLEINCNETCTIPKTQTPIDDFKTQLIFKLGPQDRPDRPNRTIQTINNNTRITYQKQQYPEASVRSIITSVVSKNKGNIAIDCDDNIAEILAKWIKTSKNNNQINLCRIQQQRENNIAIDNPKLHETPIRELPPQVPSTSPEEDATQVQENQDLSETREEIRTLVTPTTNANIQEINSPTEQLRIIIETHTKDHRGANENYAQIRKKYKFANTKEMIQKYINNCDVCNRTKYDRNPIQMEQQLTETATKPNERVHIDTFSLRSKQFLTIIDGFSRFASAYELPNRESIKIINTLKKHFSQEGIPKTIISDCATEFTSETFKQFTNRFNFIHHKTTPKASTGNAMIERLHSTLTELIRVKFDENRKIKTDDLMTEAIIAYNNSIHSATNFTPMELHRAHIILQKFPENLATEDFAKTIQSEYSQRIEAIADKQNRNKLAKITKTNKNKEPPPQLQTSDIIYEKLHTRDKTAPKYMKHTITQNFPGPTANTNKRKIHKKNIKRHSIITASPDQST